MFTCSPLDASGLQTQVDAAHRDVEADDHESFPIHRQILDTYAFLIYWFVLAADKMGHKAGDDPAAFVSKPKVC